MACHAQTNLFIKSKIFRDHQGDMIMVVLHFQNHSPRIIGVIALGSRKQELVTCWSVTSRDRSRPVANSSACEWRRTMKFLHKLENMFMQPVLQFQVSSSFGWHFIRIFKKTGCGLPRPVGGSKNFETLQKCVKNQHLACVRFSEWYQQSLASYCWKTQVESDFWPTL